MIDKLIRLERLDFSGEPEEVAEEARQRRDETAAILRRHIMNQDNQEVQNGTSNSPAEVD